MPSLTIREYNNESGALLGNVSTLNFGKITAGTHSRVKVIDIAFTEVTAVGNIKIGLISSGDLPVNTTPTGIAADGSSTNGHFGIEHSKDFDDTKGASSLTRHFAGINTTITAANTYNVLIENRSTTISEYIYLDIEIGSSDINYGNGAYKIFFDYS